jgi:hypothetical protein
MDKEIKLQKIPIKPLIEALTELYNTGALYFDIIGIPNVNQDTIGLNIRNEYMIGVEDIEFDDDEDDDDEENFIEKKYDFTDDDLDKFISE